METPPARGKIEQISFDPLANLLKQAAPQKAEELEALLARLRPVCELDRESNRILFQTQQSPCLVRIGVRCTYRLQAHAYAAGVFLSAVSTPGYLTMGSEQRQKLFAPADTFLTWAVSRDLQQWLNTKGRDFALAEIMQGSEKELPEELLSGLSRTQRVLGDGLFRYAAAFILLHELAHLGLSHTPAEGHWSFQQEKEADRFASDWLLDGGTRCGLVPHRISVLLGIATALLWITVLNVYLGPHQSETHPEGYDRLFQVLDHAIDPDDEKESLVVWDVVGSFLFLHFDNAGFEFDASKMQGSPRDEVNYMIDVLSKSGQR
jgi:Peptidase U49